MSQSKLEDKFATQLMAAGIPYERQVKVIEGRRFRFDFHIQGTNLLIEIQGGTWSGGRHTRGTGYASDCEKFNLAIIAGFRVLKADSKQTTSGQLLEWTQKAIASSGKVGTVQPKQCDMELF